MISKLRQLAAQLELIDDDDLLQLAPKTEIQDGDEVFGTLPDELRRLFALKEQLRRLALAIELRLVTGPEYVELLPELQLRANLANALFWIQVIHLYPNQYRRGDLGVVFKGWLIGRRSKPTKKRGIPSISGAEFKFDLEPPEDDDS